MSGRASQLSGDRAERMVQADLVKKGVFTVRQYTRHAGAKYIESQGCDLIGDRNGHAVYVEVKVVDKRLPISERSGWRLSQIAWMHDREKHGALCILAMVSHDEIVYVDFSKAFHRITSTRARSYSVWDGKLDHWSYYKKEET